MATEEFYRVPVEGTTREQFHAAAADLQFSLADTWGGADQEEAYEEVWAAPDRRSAINYVEDNISQMPYLCIRQQTGSDLLERLGRRLPVYQPTALLELALTDLSRAELINTFFRIAISFPDYDSDVANTLGGAALRHADPNIRAAAISAIAYRAWPLLRTVVDVAAHNDPVDEVRSQAEAALSRWPE